MKKIILILLAICLCIPFAACANKEQEISEEPSSEQPELSEESEEEIMIPEPTYNVPEKPVDVYAAFKECTVTISGGKSASFRLFVPDGYNPEAKYPVVMLLHGAGERGNDNRAQLINATQNLYNDLTSPVYGAIFIVPQCPVGKQWVNQSWVPGKYDLASTPESDEIKMALGILEWVEKTYNVDENRRYAMGISMGGFGAWDLILRHNDMFAGAVIMCGGGGDPKLASTVLDTPIYLVHSKDDTAVAYSGAAEMANAIKALGGKKLVFQSLEGYGHGVWNYTSQNVLVMPWLFSQVKEAQAE